MLSFAKPILLSLAVALGLYGLGVLFANMYLQSRGVQGRIRDGVTLATGLPVTINRTYYTPWSGLALSGVAVPPTHPSMKTPLLEIESVQVSLSLFALLDGRIHIKDIVLHRPRIVSRQHSNGSWSFNEHPAIAGPDTSEQPKADPAVLEGISTPQVAAPPDIPPPPMLPSLVIESFHIRKGSAVFYMADGRPGLELADVSLESSIATDGHANGTFLAGTAIIGNIIKPTNLSGSFTWQNTILDMPNISASLAGGLVSAVFKMSSGEQPLFSTSVAAQDISLARFAADAGFNPEGTEGQVSGTFTLTGSPGTESTYKGTARLECSKARMLPIDPIRQLGDMFQIKELQVLELGAAHADLTIANGKISVDDITLATDNVIMDATGFSSFDGNLNLKARFHVSDDLHRKTGRILGKKFANSEAPGFSHMPFSITGTIHRPKTDLLDKIVGSRIQRELGGILKSFLQFPTSKSKSTPSQPLASPKPER